MKCAVVPERCLFSINFHYVHLRHSFNFDGTFEGIAVLIGKYLLLPNVSDFGASDCFFTAEAKLCESWARRFFP